MSWAVATVAPCHEAVSARELQRASVETFAPRCRAHRYAPLRILFPGYLFVRPVSAWSAVTRARGVTGVLGLETGRPCIVTDREMSRVTDQLDEDGILTCLDPMGAGASVRSRLLDWCGVVEEVVSANRMRVRFAAMGREVRAAVNRADLVLA